MAECVKITYDPESDTLELETVTSPPGLAPWRTITITMGAWPLNNDGFYEPPPFSVVESGEAQLSALRLVMPRVVPGHPNLDINPGVGVGFVWPGYDDPEYEAFGQWVGWVTAEVTSQYPLGPILGDMRPDNDTVAVVGAWWNFIFTPDDEEYPQVPQNTTVVLRLYEEWPGPPTKEKFWTELQGCREMVE